MKKAMYAMVGLIFLWAGATSGLAADREILGVTFPGEKVVEGKTLKLNGVAYRKALGIVKVYVVGLYLENPTQDPQQIIESEQVKHMVTHYLTDKATAKKLSEGFVETIEECNPPELVQAHKAEIQTYASWLDKDMKPGLTSTSTYLPGKGITLVYQGEERGTIPGQEFARMYYRYNVGEKADKRIRQGLLGQ
jgi:Chalcone isomerase-like